MNAFKYLASFIVCMIFFSCATGGEVVKVTTVTNEKKLEGLGKEELARLDEIRASKKEDDHELKLSNVIRNTQNYSVEEYLAFHPDANNPSVKDYRLGGYDIISIIVYEEPDLSRENVSISANGYISFPFLGRVKVDGLTTSELENLISRRLTTDQYILNAHISVSVTGYNSKRFLILGSVNGPGTYPLQAKERVLDAISKAGGIDFEQGGKQGMIVRIVKPDTPQEKKIVIRIDLEDLLKGGDQISNLLMEDRDLIYIPKADFYYIIGQVSSPGKYPYQEKRITLVEAISAAGGFTPIAARNRTRILRVENGVEKIIEVKVDAITKSGQKSQDIAILPGDVIVVPESYF